MGTMRANGLDLTCTEGRGSEPILRNPDLRMIERGFLILHPPVGERDQKIDELLLLSLGQTKRLDTRIQVPKIETTEITASVEELHNLP